MESRTFCTEIVFEYWQRSDCGTQLVARVSSRRCVPDPEERPAATRVNLSHTTVAWLHRSILSLLWLMETLLLRIQAERFRELGGFGQKDDCRSDEVCERTCLDEGSGNAGRREAIVGRLRPS